jgi:Zn-dependent M28 family amino/carboxypeptidase
LVQTKPGGCGDRELGGVLATVSADSILATVEALCSYETRRFASPGAAAAAEFISGKLRRLGFPVEHHHVDVLDRHNNPAVVTNVLSEIGPSAAEDGALIICAHYDSRGEDWLEPAPGADDNASGVAVLLEVARVLRGAGIAPSVTLVFFGGEEDDLIGSRAYAGQLSDRDVPVRGVINVDMVGYDEHGPRDIVVFTNPSSMPLAREMIRTAEPFVHLVVDTTVTLKGNSDHASFWEYERRAVSIWEGYDHNPYHGTTEDRPSTLSRGFLVDVTRWVVASAVCMSLTNSDAR